VITYDTIANRVAAGEFQGLLVMSGSINPAYGEADAQKLRKAGSLVVIDTHVTPLAVAADAVFGGATFAEKAGTFVNADGRLQYSEAALPPRDGSLPDLDLLAILSGKGTAPVNSRAILAEVASTIPAFAVVKGGTVPEFGIVIGVENQPQIAGAFTYNDPWMVARTFTAHPTPAAKTV
jgi:NADH-quinone oxidoreductase subunit G